VQYAIATVLFVHGVAHIVGLVVFWRLTELEEMPYKTTVLAGKIDVGDVGIRIVGLLWLATALAYFACALAVIPPLWWWLPATIGVTVFSLVLCITGWPDAQFGLVVNLLIFVLLALGWWLGRLPAAAT
jgi:hypothetical protein